MPYLMMGIRPDCSGLGTSSAHQAGVSAAATGTCNTRLIALPACIVTKELCTAGSRLCERATDKHHPPGMFAITEMIELLHGTKLSAGAGHGFEPC